MATTYIMNQVHPYVLDLMNQRSTTRNPLKIILNLMNDGKLLAVSGLLGYCTRDSLGDQVIKQMIISKNTQGQWEEVKDKHYCCNYSRLLDSDIPKDWKDHIRTNVGVKHMLRARSI